MLGVVTDKFLDFSASRGNNLRDIGLTDGCKWCLCTARWKEAMDAAKGPDDPVVPKYVNRALFSKPRDVPYINLCHLLLESSSMQQISQLST